MRAYNEERFQTHRPTASNKTRPERRENRKVPIFETTRGEAYETSTLASLVGPKPVSLPLGPRRRRERWTIPRQRAAGNFFLFFLLPSLPLLG